MAANYVPHEPDQMLLLPESLQEWLPERHLAHLTSDAVDGLDLGAFRARYDKDGPRNQPFCSCRSCAWHAKGGWSSSAPSRWTAPRSRPTRAATSR